MPSFFANLFLSATLWASVEASGFLGMTASAEIEQSLSRFAAEANSARILSVESDLRPMYATLPKNAHGKLEPPVVRYALSRYFAQKYGWHLKGIELAGGSWSASSPSSVTKEQVPSYIQSLFEKQLDGHGLGLQGLAVFAQTLLHLIYKEIDEDTLHIYDVLGLSTVARIEKSIVHKIVMMTLTKRINGLQQDSPGAGEQEIEGTLEEFVASQAYLVENYWGWETVEEWAEDSHANFAYKERFRRNPFKNGFDYKSTVSLLQEMSHEFGHIQNHECRKNKDLLLSLEDEGTGRVRLPKFYSGSERDEDWPFIEKARYLSSMGVLDESNPSRPSVVIPNYLHSNSNCVGSSGLYSVCCIDECESLLAHLERESGHPQGDVARIVEVVSNLPSDTVDAPRNLSTLLLSRLDEIAAHHGGHVPLHGRLFSQFMHHAFPHECPFPHMSGTTNPMYATEWVVQNKEDDMYASDEELEMHMASDVPEISIADLPWSSVEELVSSHKFKPEQSTFSSPFRTAMVLVAAASSAVGMLHVSKVVTEDIASAKTEKYSL